MSDTAAPAINAQRREEFVDLMREVISRIDDIDFKTVADGQVDAPYWFCCMSAIRRDAQKYLEALSA